MSDDKSPAASIARRAAISPVARGISQLGIEVLSADAFPAAWLRERVARVDDAEPSVVPHTLAEPFGLSVGDTRGGAWVLAGEARPPRVLEWFVTHLPASEVPYDGVLWSPDLPSHRGGQVRVLGRMRDAAGREVAVRLQERMQLGGMLGAQDMTKVSVVRTDVATGAQRCDWAVYHSDDGSVLGDDGFWSLTPRADGTYDFTTKSVHQERPRVFGIRTPAWLASDRRLGAKLVARGLGAFFRAWHLHMLALFAGERRQLTRPEASAVGLYIDAA